MGPQLGEIEGKNDIAVGTQILLDQNEKSRK